MSRLTTIMIEWSNFNCTVIIIPTNEQSALIDKVSHLSEIRLADNLTYCLNG